MSRNIWLPAGLIGLLPLVMWPIPGLPFFVFPGQVVALAAALILPPRRRSGAWRKDPLVPLSLLLVAMAAAAFRTRAGAVALQEGLTWLSGAAVFSALPRLLEKAGEDRWPTRAAVLQGLAIGGVVAASYGLLDFVVTMYGLPSGSIYRTPSFLLDPQLLSAYMTLLIPVAVSLHLGAGDRKPRLLWGTASVIMAAALTATYTRAGWLASLGAVFLLGLLLDRRLWWKAAVVVVALALVFPGVIGRASTAANATTDTSNAGRITLWRSALIMFRERPLQGVGLGNFPLELSRLEAERPDIKAPPDARYPHNSPLYVLSETGLSGFVPFLWLAVSLFASLVGGYRLATGDRANAGLAQEALRAGALASFLAFGLHANFQSLLHTPVSALPFWIMLAAAAGAAGAPASRETPRQPGSRP